MYLSECSHLYHRSSDPLEEVPRPGIGTPQEARWQGGVPEWTLQSQPSSAASADITDEKRPKRKKVKERTLGRRKS